jgi:hypothetical protein
MTLTFTRVQIAVALASYLNDQNLNVKAKPEDINFTNVEGEFGATVDLESVSRGRARKAKAEEEKPAELAAV